MFRSLILIVIMAAAFLGTIVRDPWIGYGVRFGLLFLGWLLASWLADKISILRGKIELGKIYEEAWRDLKWRHRLLKAQSLVIFCIGLAYWIDYFGANHLKLTFLQICIFTVGIPFIVERFLTFYFDSFRCPRCHNRFHAKREPAMGWWNANKLPSSQCRSCDLPAFL